MRATDLAPPAVTFDGHSRPVWMSGRLVVALERLPQAAYVWDDTDPTVMWDAAQQSGPIVSHGYLTPTVGTVTTPDPGPLPEQYTWVTHVAGPWAGTWETFAAQHETMGQYSWRWDFHSGMPAMRPLTTSDGQDGGLVLPWLPFPAMSPWMATSMVRDNDAGQAVSTGYVSTDGLTWSQVASASDPAFPVFDSSSVVRVGAADGAGVQTVAGRIYSVELRTGLDPAAGTVLWRFDADDYPGTGTSYSDPRGRTWTLTNASAITPPVREMYPELVWDAPFVGSGFSDVWCDLTALDITAGGPDQYEGYPTGYCQLKLRDPGDGRYMTRTVDGRLVYFALGRRLAVYWLDPDGEPWWLFSGSIATWRQHLDGNVEIEAYACTGDLAQSIGRTWTAGTAGQFPGPRATAILTALGSTVTTRFELGDITLSVPDPADVPPVNVLRRVAASDGGLLYADADDTLVLRDRRWRDGRTDQVTVPTFTDNVCEAGAGVVVVWDPVAADTDLVLAGTVRIENDADPPLVAVAVGDTTMPNVFTHQEADLWESQVDGDAVAAHQAHERSNARMALGAADVHLHDRRFDYWTQAVDLRLGDRVRWLHEDRYTDRAELYDLSLVVNRVEHHVTPESWTVNLGDLPRRRLHDGGTVGHDAVHLGRPRPARSLEITPWPIPRSRSARSHRSPPPVRRSRRRGPRTSPPRCPNSAAPSGSTPPPRR